MNDEMIKELKSRVDKLERFKQKVFVAIGIAAFLAAFFGYKYIDYANTIGKLDKRIKRITEDFANVRKDELEKFRSDVRLVTDSEIRRYNTNTLRVDSIEVNSHLFFPGKGKNIIFHGGPTINPNYFIESYGNASADAGGIRIMAHKEISFNTSEGAILRVDRNAIQALKPLHVYGDIYLRRNFKLRGEKSVDIIEGLNRRISSLEDRFPK